MDIYREFAMSKFVSQEDRSRAMVETITALRAKLAEAERERDEALAKIEAAGKQEPVGEALAVHWQSQPYVSFAPGFKMAGRERVLLFTAPPITTAVTLEAFKVWMVNELPPLTTIGNPEWWAKRIYDRFIKPAATPSTSHDKEVG